MRTQPPATSKTMRSPFLERGTVLLAKFPAMLESEFVSDEEAAQCRVAVELDLIVQVYIDYHLGGDYRGGLEIEDGATDEPPIQIVLVETSLMDPCLSRGEVSPQRDRRFLKVLERD